MAKFTKENAAEYGAKGGKRSGESKRLHAMKSAEERARHIFREDAESVAKELVAAAKGEGLFEKLDPGQRVKAMKMVLEWAMGRPYTPKPKPQEDQEDKTEGLTIE